MVFSRRKSPVFSRQTRASLANGLVGIINSVSQTATDSLMLPHHAALHLSLAPTHFPKSTGSYSFFLFLGFFLLLCLSVPALNSNSIQLNCIENSVQFTDAAVKAK